MLLAVETSCDETSVAVVHQGRILANVVSSQIKLHAEYGGVVPELASRDHIRRVVPLTQDVLAQASGSISASTTTCAINTTTFAASGTTGSYTSPAVALVANDVAWFSKASV